MSKRCFLALTNLMVTPNQSFNKTLEQYALKVANLFIESADQATQSELIQFISRIDTTSGPVENHTEVVSGVDLESEWQQIFDVPVDWVSVQNHRLISQIRHRIKRNELYMAHLKQAILTVEQRCQRAQNTIVYEPNRSNLLNRHRKTQVCFQQQLDLAQREQQVNLNQLCQLEKSGVNRKYFP